jgi:hypothetical protein
MCSCFKKYHWVPLKIISTHCFYLYLLVSSVTDTLRTVHVCNSNSRLGSKTIYILQITCLNVYMDRFFLFLLLLYVGTGIGCMCIIRFSLDI